MCVCWSVCMNIRSHISRTASQNFPKFSVYVICGLCSVLLCGGVEICYILPVFWMVDRISVKLGERAWVIKQYLLCVTLLQVAVV